MRFTKKAVVVGLLSALAPTFAACGDDGAAGGGGGTATSGLTSSSPSASQSGGPTSASGSGSPSSSASGSSTAEGSSSASTSESGASTTGDASSSSMALPMCDDDGDGFSKIGPGCASMMAPTADCDDDDADVYPGQTAWFTTPRGGIADPVERWDYDCDGTAGKQWVHHTDPCGALLGLCNQGGDSFNGAQDAYDCGVQGTLTNCVAVLGGCNATPATLGCH